MTQPTPAAAPPAVCYRHPHRATYISCIRCGRPICPDCMRPASVGFQCPEEGSGPPVRDVRTGSGQSGLVRMWRTAPVTTTLIGLNALVFAVLVASGSSLLGTGESALQERLVQTSIRLQFGAGPATQGGLADGQYWRLLTAMFVHYGLIHIGSNMFVLAVIGRPLEQRIGRLRFAAIYLVSGLGGGVATYLFADPRSASAGASGAIFGLLGAYAVVARRTGTGELGPIAGTIVLNLIITFSIPGISITDHLGGLAVGALLGAIILGGQALPARAAERARAVTLQVVGVAAVAVVLTGLVAVRTHELHHRYGPRAAGITAPVGPSAAAPTPGPPPVAG